MFKEFLGFFSWYLWKKSSSNFSKFERFKNAFVKLLLKRRGAYHEPVLHTGMLLLIISTVNLAPFISDRYPILGSETQIVNPSSVLKTLTAEEIPVITEISDKPRDKVVIYIVKNQDTLTSIAKDFDISIDSLRWLNDLSFDNLSIGQELKIPPVSGIVHKVKSGDTIYSLAKKYQTDAQKIANWPFNEFTNQETLALAVGTELVIPDGVPPKTIRPSPVYIAQIPSLPSGSLFIWPAIGEITQYPIWYHNAVDIANGSAPRIVSAGNGVVEKTECLRFGYGCNIIIRHDNQLQTLYAHLQAIYVNPGISVTSGQVIGKMGSSGRSTGIHLHFEVRKNGVIVNPLGYLKK